MVSAVVDLDNKLIAAVEASKKILAEEYQVRSLPPKAQDLVNKIYKDRGYKSISGREGKMLLEQMTEVNASSKDEVSSLVASYRKAIDKIIEQVTNLKRSLLPPKE